MINLRTFPAPRRRPDAGPRRRGAVLVETALVLPLFLMVVLAIIEIGRAMMVANMVTNAAREGARVATIEGNTNSDVENYIEAFLQNALGVSADDVSVKIQINPAPGNPDPLNQVAKADPKDLINVTVQVPYDAVSYIPGDYMADRVLRGHAAMRRH